MVRMSAIWDRTSEVIRGRAGILAAIAGLLLFAPSVVNAAISARNAAAPGHAGLAALGGLVSLIVAVLAVWAGLAIVAVASDPDVDRAEALRRAAPRILPMIGVALVLGVAFLLLFAPAIALLAAGGLSGGGLAADGTLATADMSAVSPGAAAAAGLYMIFAVCVLFWVGARLALLNPVVLHERLGLGAIARSWRLTRGMGWRIVGVYLLFLIVLLVVAVAVHSVTLLVFRLLLGPDATATTAFLARAASAVVTSGAAIVSGVFTAQLYQAVSGREAAQTFA